MLDVYSSCFFLKHEEIVRQLLCILIFFGSLDFELGELFFVEERGDSVADFPCAAMFLSTLFIYYEKYILSWSQFLCQVSIHLVSS